MEVEETRQKKTWWDCIRVDMKSSDLSHEETHDGDLWRLRGRDGRNGLLGANWKIADTVVCVCYSIRPEKPNVVRDNRLVKQKKQNLHRKRQELKPTQPVLLLLMLLVPIPLQTTAVLISFCFFSRHIFIDLLQQSQQNNMHSHIMQIMTGIEVNSEAYFPNLRDYCPSAEGMRAIFPQLREIRLTIDR